MLVFASWLKQNLVRAKTVLGGKQWREWADLQLSQELLA